MGILRPKTRVRKKRKALSHLLALRLGRSMLLAVGRQASASGWLGRGAVRRVRGGAVWRLGRLCGVGFLVRGLLVMAQRGSPFVGLGTAREIETNKAGAGR